MSPNDELADVIENWTVVWDFLDFRAAGGIDESAVGYGF